MFHPAFSPFLEFTIKLSLKKNNSFIKKSNEKLKKILTLKIYRNGDRHLKLPKT